MSKIRHDTEEIIYKLKEADVLLDQGQTIGQVCRQLGITDQQTYHRWRKAYGGINIDQARRLRELEAENTRLKRVVADLTVDKLILEEAVQENA